MTIYLMSIEKTPGQSQVSGFHLGTDEDLARSLVVERFYARVAAHLPVVTIALMDNTKKVLDVFTGNGWSSQMNVGTIYEAVTAAMESWLTSGEKNIDRMRESIDNLVYEATNDFQSKHVECTTDEEEGTE